MPILINLAYLVYFILLHFALLCFNDSAFKKKKIEDLCQSCIKQVYWHRFSNSIFSPHVSVSHFGNSHNIP